ncbi:unnamed protein product [Closterium sp. NIES-53]
MLRTTLAALGFAPSTADPSLFLRTDTSLPLFYILVYVDDIVFATADTVALTLVKSELHKRHTCTDQGELRSYLGLQITRDRARRTITLTYTLGMGLVLGGRGPVVLTGHANASSVDDSATLRSSGEQPRSPPQRGQLRLAYVATRANNADVFTKALSLGDHRRFATVLGFVPTLPHLLTA